MGPGPYRTMGDHTGPYVTIQDLKDLTGPYGSIQEHTGPYVTRFHHM